MATPPAEDLPADRQLDEPDRTPEPDARQRAGRHQSPERTDQPGRDPAPAVPGTAEIRSPGVPMAPKIRPTRISGTWAAVVVAAVVLIFLLIFILQNLTTVTVNLLGFSWSMPIGVAMLFAAIAGAILVALVGTARILQLRRYAKRLGTTDRAR